MNKTTKLGLTPLILCSVNSYNYWPTKLSSIKKLLKAGACVNKTNNNGQNALKLCIAEPQRNEFHHQPRRRNTIKLLFAAGEKVDGTTVPKYGYGGDITKHVEIPQYIQQNDLELCLKHLCRMAIRNHLLKLNANTNLFCRIPGLMLPTLLKLYLLYDISLETS